MKYKLINQTTNEEHLCDKVTIDRFDYYMSNEKSLSNNDDWYLGHPNYNTLFRWEMTDIHEGKQVWINKVIATTNPNIDIPKVVDDVDELAEEITTDEHFCDSSLDYASHYKGVKMGYNKSQETHPFSEEDMIEFAEWKVRNLFFNITNFSTEKLLWKSNNKLFNVTYTTKELFQLWKEQRVKAVYYE